MKKHPLVIIVEARRAKTSELAYACNISVQAVHDWLTKAKREPDTWRVPPGQVRPLCKLLKVKPWALRPDLFEPHWDYKQATTKRRSA